MGIDFINKYRVLLCNLINILDKENKITGITCNSRSTNSSLKNINKFLEVLRMKKVNCLYYYIKNIPYDYLWSEDEILAGNGNVIRNLLKQIKKAYNKETESIIGTNNNM